MTVCVAFKNDGELWMGEDSFSGTTDHYEPDSRSKIQTCGDMVIASAGAVWCADRVLHMAAAKMSSVNPNTMSPYEVVLSTIAASIHEHMELWGSDEWQCEFLVAYEGELLTVDSRGGVQVPTSPFVAIGGGAPYAYGAYHGLKLDGRSPMRTHEVVLVTLRAAIAMSPICTEPYRVCEIGMEDDEAEDISDGEVQEGTE